MEKSNPISQTNETMNRRAFFKYSGLLGLGLTSVGILPATAEAVKFNNDTYKVSDTRAAMGTYVSMTWIHSSRDQAQEAMGLPYIEIERLALQGDGVGRITAAGNEKGKVAFVPYSLPGETIRAEKILEKKTYGRWLPEEIERSSPDPNAPPSPYHIQPHFCCIW